MDSRDRVAIARSMIEAFARRDTEGLTRHMTEDVLIRSTPFVTGRGEYRGRGALRDGLAKMDVDFAATGKRLRIIDHAYYVDGADDRKVMALAEIRIQRASGEEFGTQIAYLSIFEGDLICEVDAWLEHVEGLKQLEQPIRFE
jgi:SnoaL-like domain